MLELHFPCDLPPSLNFRVEFLAVLGGFEERVVISLKSDCPTFKGWLVLRVMKFSNIWVA